MITLNLLLGQDQERPAGIPELRDLPKYYKIVPPLSMIEWTVTLSRYDFPWNEIAKELDIHFNARECYKMYRSLVGDDPNIFLKKVLRDKVKFQKLMHNQLAGGVL